jgi:DNA-binding NarL/FixJ family response regulator
MVNPISSNKNAIEPTRADPVAKPDVAKTKIDTLKADVVELSHSTQAKLLKQQGFDVPEIALKLGLDVKTVSTFFPSFPTKG